MTIHETLHWATLKMTGQLQGADSAFSGVSTDTRSLKPGEIFFCLMGARDGHEFISQAAAQGAVAVVVDAAHAANISTSIPKLVVTDTLHALGDLARAWRKRFSIPIIGIGGSNGKTTCKELTRAVLDSRYRVLATEGNLNNLIGVPKTLFRLDSSHEVAIVEMGMNDFGELARLTQIVEPTAALLTNIGMEHLEKLMDLDGVARAEGELFTELSPQSLALVNLADPRVAALPSAAARQGYGTPESLVWGEILRADLVGKRPLTLKIFSHNETIEMSLQLPGPHNLSNVLAALAIGLTHGVDLKDAKQALEAFKPAASRMQMVELRDGRKMIDDCYNANPSSVMAALSTLAQLRVEGAALAILGEMLELGAYTVEGHRQVGRKAAEEKIDYLIAIGEHAPEILSGALAGGMSPEVVQQFSTPEAAIAALPQLPAKLRWLLVKGSRGIHLEKIVNYIKEQF